MVLKTRQWVKKIGTVSILDGGYSMLAASIKLFIDSYLHNR
ncbi:MAG TPA: hypothetical protein VMY06_02540 [Sedimentisphaerales bacterium]|nr:hypothetical protein [Sedimentisphaerales bacterium]